MRLRRGQEEFDGVPIGPCGECLTILQNGQAREGFLRRLTQTDTDFPNTQRSALRV